MSKTTLQGVLTILAAVITFVLAGLAHGTFTDMAAWTALIGGVTAGFGLIKAQDATP